jgi:purine-binding chemotaxis protein CheW
MIRNAVGVHDTAAQGTVSDSAQEFLTFRLGPEEYAIDILKVQEIRGYHTVTTIANAPAFIKGVINLRGTIIPIVDLRIKFGVGTVEYTPFTVVIILKVGRRTVGIVVDSVSDVSALPAHLICPAPEFNSAIDFGYILGLATLEERMLVVIDIERLVSGRDMALCDESMN